MSTGRLALALLAAVTVCPVSAANFTTTLSKGNKTIVMLTGEIVEGDAEKLNAIIQSANERVGWYLVCVLTHSAAA